MARNFDEQAIKEVVRLAVGFNDAARYRDRNGRRKKDGHQHRTPWQIILTRTRKAIKKEEGLARYSDASDGENGFMWELVDEWQEMGMHAWTDLYPQTKDVLVGLNNVLEYPRHVWDIVLYTASRTEATEDLNVNDQGYEGERIDKSKWVQAKPGWNKLNHNIVVLLPELPKGGQGPLHRVLPRFYFGPLLTAWLAAMAPRADHRVLVIRHAIRELLEFWQKGSMVPPLGTGSLEQVEVWKEWYAFHTLRRMFRMRFGCWMCATIDGTEIPEPTGKLLDFNPKCDSAFMAFKKAERNSVAKYREAAIS